MLNLSYKENPLLLFMQSKIEELLQNITDAAKENNESNRFFITIDGVSGCGKTNFVYEYLQAFLFGEGVIKSYQEKINKIGTRDLTEYNLKGRTIEEVIIEKLQGCRDNILIIDEFSEKDKNAKMIADIIKRIHASSEYKNTAVILMGDYKDNSNFIIKFKLDKFFEKKYRMSFFTPSFRQITEIFALYAMKKGEYYITDKAKNTLIFYFSNVKLIKETKANLYKAGIVKASAEERKFGYTSEMFPIYKDLFNIKNMRDANDKLIDQKDIFNCNSYKRLLDDLNRFAHHLPEKKMPDRR